MRIFPIALLVAACSWFGTPAFAAETPESIGKQIDVVVDEAIRMLEAKEDVAFLKRFTHPLDLKTYTAAKPVEELAIQFRAGRAEHYLLAFKGVKGKVPELFENQTLAGYLWDTPDRRRETLMFVRYDGVWYIHGGRQGAKGNGSTPDAKTAAQPSASTAGKPTSPKPAASAAAASAGVPKTNTAAAMRDRARRGQAFGSDATPEKSPARKFERKEEPVAADAPNAYELPLPKTAGEPAFDAEKKQIKFESTASVREVVAEFDQLLEPLGWKKKIDNLQDTVGIVIREREEARLSISMFGNAFGKPGCKVTIRVTGLNWIKK